VLKNDTLMHLS